ncbi:MAG: phage tail protein [Hydrogenophaga sp.]|uniref:phage tail protein n=1 Tax=Hydrogenophaga sp. TaxID=1904254 RepID=UPI0016A4BEC0|nr:tail fiber protein [Hydrogenophaga sp.]NIM41436.1 phage tail protein [Hydrogenophaga sp.]NIN26752.1 phage tail protein [Hydrogenophaga sp.]NIN30074.1 phage tail protein [Hydrogenophaga sp.]NIN55682.1 phage tail protein [Hydrogenophaga sp.]NIO52679.1 phage tail protein [Hydrogenophaga sp.]
MSASDPFIGEISLVAFSYAPVGWALCDGRLLSVSQNAALFALIGAAYGGDGHTTFALPDLRGRAAIGAGTGPGFRPVELAQYLGDENATVLQNNLPAHTHAASFTSGGVRPVAYSGGASVTDPTGAVPANPVGEGGAALPAFAPAAEANAGLAPLPVQGQVTVSPTGAGQPLNIRNPALGLNYIIALVGVYPPRS